MGNHVSIIPPLLVLLPLAGTGLVIYASKWGAALRAGVANLLSLAVLFLSVWQLLLVQGGRVLVYGLDWYIGFGLKWEVDFLSAVFGVIVSLVWFFSTLMSVEYLAGGHGQTRYYAASIFTLGSTLGVFLAGDLLSFFLFFELMTFAAYLLVVHEESGEAIRAGNVYLFMSIIGGLFLLGVIFFIQHTTGSTEFRPVLAELIEAGLNPWVLFAVVLLGFGVKAGMLPLHIWLPKAHPVAPAPASALLSALMIKTGAYGFLRFFYTLFSLSQDSTQFFLQESFGYVFLWLGAITMLGGALMALIHTPMKRILAYSSISQMGYILFSLGAGVFLGSDGVWGLAGAWLHMINHAFFKSFLFLLAGVVYLQTGDLDLDKLGGLRRQMPLTFGFFLIAAAGITGIPGFNGYVSKILIHDGILHAFAVKGWASLLWLERIFVFTGGLTAAYISKIWLKTFLGKPQAKLSHVQDLSPGSAGVFCLYTVILLGIGLWAQTRVNQLVLPVLLQFGFAGEEIRSLQTIPFWDWHELKGPFYSYLIAGIVLLLQYFLKGKIQVPAWLSIEKLVYRPLYLGAKYLFTSLERLGVGVQRGLRNLIPTGKRKEPARKKAGWSSVNWFRNKTSLRFDLLLICFVLLVLLVFFLFR